MDNIIAKGGFTEIYQGSIDNEVVVVKKPINGSVLENKQIENQVIILSQVSHKNIVRLIGFCLEVETPVLVYELISKGSIDNVLHSSNSVPLDLDVRLTIIAESAQGLAYLHSQARIKIRHGNVTPVNILLDEKFMPKIAGFGISRLIARDNEHTCNVIGDLSYIDPIYLQTGLLTEKSDVYSFGIVILEVISRKKATYSDDDNLVNSFLDVHRKGKKTTELFDKEIALAGNLEILDYLAEIAVQCLNLDVDQRPTMTYVAERLLTVQRYHRSKLFSNELMHTVV
jgi:serine/threonine protein kinase